MNSWDQRLKTNRIVDMPPGPVGNQASIISEEDKHPYVPPLKMTADLSPEQKETVKYFNSMRKMLLEQDLMQTKIGGA